MVVINERGSLVNILLIEDNLGDAKLIELAFRRMQLPTQVTVAETAEQALEFLQGKDQTTQYQLPDLILLDLNLPTMHGLKFLKLVKSDPVLTLIPVLVLSSSSAQKDISKSYKSHANAFMTKPNSLEGYMTLATTISDYWFKVVRTPWGSKKASAFG